LPKTRGKGKTDKDRKSGASGRRRMDKGKYRTKFDPPKVVGDNPWSRGLTGPWTSL